VLNNGDIGLYADGSADKILTNTANGNTSEGIRVIGSLDTITGNTANYNTDFGINAVSPQIDGGTNKATGNTQQSQCTGVVCAVE
jgi:parallel beta-helix repeat protein